jgi:putative SOS response-associated peptidase YedK
LWEIWHSSEGDEVRSCAIITTTPNALMEKIHDRMPVMLKPEAYEAWLSPEEAKPERLNKLLKPFPATLMTAYEVSPAVNSPANDAPEVIRPV